MKTVGAVYEAAWAIACDECESSGDEPSALNALESVGTLEEAYEALRSHLDDEHGIEMCETWWSSNAQCEVCEDWFGGPALITAPEGSGYWLPPHRAKCLTDYMAGNICGLPSGHDGPHN